MRLLSWNIQGRSSDLASVAKVLQEAKADVILLQECDVGLRRSEWKDQPLEIAQRLHTCAIFASAMRIDNGHYGLAVLTRRTVSQVTTVSIRRVKGAPEPRIAVAFRGPKVPGIATAHLSQKPQGAAFAELTDLLPRLPDWVRLLAGDFNHRPRQPLPASWHERSPMRRGEYAPTWPVPRPTKAIDRVLTKGPSLRVTSSPIYTAVSDHLPILVEISE